MIKKCLSGYHSLNTWLLGELFNTNTNHHCKGTIVLVSRHVPETRLKLTTSLMIYKNERNIKNTFLSQFWQWISFLLNERNKKHHKLIVIIWRLKLRIFFSLRDNFVQFVHTLSNLFLIRQFFFYNASNIFIYFSTYYFTFSCLKFENIHSIVCKL